MTKAKQKSDWDHTAATLACIHNAMGSSVSVESFHPYSDSNAKKKKQSITHSIKGLFT